MQGNELQLPRVIREAATVVSTVEGATNSSPVSLDTVTGNSLAGTLRGYIGEVDILYDRREALFSPVRTGGRLHFDAYDYPGILDLTEAALHTASMQYGLHRGTSLGLGALQLAAAGASIAQKPLRLPAEQGGAMETAVVEEAGKYATDLFSTLYSDKVRGDYSQVPSARLGYPGCIMDNLYTFWYWVRNNPRTTGLGRTHPDIYAQLPSLLSRFPDKSAKHDAHSIVGRPDSGTARQEYMSGIAAFEQSSLLDTPPVGLDVRSNISDIIVPISETLRAAADKGYSHVRRLQVAIHNSHVIGRLCERTADGSQVGQEAYTLTDSESTGLPTLTIAYPDELPNASANVLPLEIQEKLRRRGREGSICPARFLLPLDRDGITHSNVQVLADAIYDYTGVTPPLLHEHRRSLRLDVAALAVNYTLLILATNPEALSLMTA